MRLFNLFLLTKQSNWLWRIKKLIGRLGSGSLNSHGSSSWGQTFFFEDEGHSLLPKRSVKNNSIKQNNKHHFSCRFICIPFDVYFFCLFCVMSASRPTVCAVDVASSIFLFWLNYDYWCCRFPVASDFHRKRFNKSKTMQGINAEAHWINYVIHFLIDLLLEIVFLRASFLQIWFACGSRLHVSLTFYSVYDFPWFTYMIKKVFNDSLSHAKVTLRFSTAILL